MNWYSLIVVLGLTMPLEAAKIVLVAGGGEKRGLDKPIAPREARLVTPFGVDFDAKGRLYFVEMEKGERLAAIMEDGLIHTLAGNGRKGPVADNTTRLDTTFNGIHGLACIDNDVMIADTWNNCIRLSKTDSSYSVSRLIGTGEKGFSGDGGPPLRAKLGGAFSVCLDRKTGMIYVTDLDNRRIRAISLKDNNISTVAGNGSRGIPSDGKKATEQGLLDPRACAIDSNSNLYILERNGHCLRVVDEAGVIRTVAGTGQAGMTVGDALSSQMNGPKHCCCDQNGNVYIADSENHRILQYRPKESKVIIVAGTGRKGAQGLNGDPLQAELNRPHGVTVHPKTGELYICDSYNDRILRIIP